MHRSFREVIELLESQGKLVKIKNLYLSFDTGKLTSTLINLDIEELCYCLACALFKYIEYTHNNFDIDDL